MKLTIPMSPHPKERPRFGSGRVFMSDVYRSWKSRFAYHARAQWKQPAHKGLVRVNVVFQTITGNCRGDMDNNVGAVWDAMQSIVILDDRQIKAGSFSIVKGDVEMIEVEVLGIGAGA